MIILKSQVFYQKNVDFCLGSDLLKKLSLFIICLVIFLCGFFVSKSFLNNNQNDVIKNTSSVESQLIESISDDPELITFLDAYLTMKNHYVENINPSHLLNASIHTMVEELDDYSSFVEKNEVKEFIKKLNLKAVGLGFKFEIHNNYPIIIDVFKGTSASKYNLRKFDKITKINGVDTYGLTQSKVSKLFKGKLGDKIIVEVLRAESLETMSKTLTLNKYELATTSSNILNVNDRKVGFIKLNAFMNDSHEPFLNQLSILEQENIDSLIVDLRDNGGGELTTLKKIADALIPNKKMIFSSKYRNSNKTNYYSELNNKKPYNIVALINQNTRSSAEILAGALNQSGGYDLIGTSTYGKGVIQSPKELVDGSLLLFTTQKWFTPNGENIEGIGLNPTFKVEQLFNDIFPLYKEPTTPDEIMNAKRLLNVVLKTKIDVDGSLSDNTLSLIETFNTKNNILSDKPFNEHTIKLLNQLFINEISNPENDLQLQTAIKLATN